ncbi:MAG: acyltransferase [Dehalococcoidia bacterium]|nr:acyltransferase [Dehalococcoidia bacterium]
MSPVSTIRTSAPAHLGVEQHPGPSGINRLGYVAALGGLRGVAVLAVCMLHFHVPFLPGGYLGVDLFFVLSGFLISSLLAAEWHDHASIDLWRFYGRRVLRLLPALYAMLLILTPLLTAEQFIAGLGYTENLIMVSGQQLDYLNHHWSLAIEEQFYLAWPIALLVLFRLGFSRQKVLWVLVALVAIVTANRVAQALGDPV